MPSPSRWMIRGSFIYLLVGFLLGAILLINKAYPLYPQVWTLLAIHIEVLIFGWIIQLTLGTAYWILPKNITKQPRKIKKPALLMATLLNGGILLNISDHLFRFWEHAWVAGRSLELLAVVLFIALHWERVTSFRMK